MKESKLLFSPLLTYTISLNATLFQTTEQQCYLEAYLVETGEYSGDA